MKWFVEYLERNFLIEKNRELEEMVLRHHESQLYLKSCGQVNEDRRLRRMATIISVADNYSSAEKEMKIILQREISNCTFRLFILNSFIG